MRRDVLARVEPRSPGFGDHLYNVLTVLAAPAPYIVRAALSGVLVISLVATASVASADALPDEPLYGLKVASEQVRLALAQSPEDRAAVWLSMAEHRLAEAERLALADQQARAADIAERLRTGSATAQSAPAFDTVASAPPAEASGTISELIAEHAASVTDQVAAAAAQRAQDVGVEEEPTPEPAAPSAPVVEAPPARVAPARPATAPRVAPPAGAAAQPQGIGNVTLPDPTAVATTAAQETAPSAPPAARSEGSEDASATPKGTPTTLEKLAEVSRQWKAAIEKIREQQKQAREAQQKAKERGKKTPAPAGQRSRDDDNEDGKSEKDKGGTEREEDDD
jgi:hypothetical protein